MQKQNANLQDLKQNKEKGCTNSFPQRINKNRKKEDNKMKKKIVGIVLVVLIGIAFVVGSTVTSNYTKDVEVVKVENDVVTIVDNQGMEYSFFGEGFEVGETITVEMNINHTEQTREDDVIKRVIE